MAVRGEGDGSHGKVRQHQHQQYQQQHQDGLAGLDSFRNGYVKSCVTPLRQDPARGLVFSACRSCGGSQAARVSAVYAGALAALTASFFLSRRFQSAELRVLLTGVSQSLSPLFSIGCAHFFLTFYLRRRKRDSSRCWLLALPVSCYLGDFAALCFMQWGPGEDSQHMHTVARLLFVLGCVGLLTLLPTLKLRHSVLVLVFASGAWLLAHTGLGCVAQWLRPLIACAAAVSGSLLGLGFDRSYPPRESSGRTCTGGEDRVPVVRPRRRSSCVSLGETSSSYYASWKMPRRPSLPCISREQVGTMVTF